MPSAVIEAVNTNAIYTGELNFSLDATTDKLAWIMVAQAPVTVDRIAACFNSKTGTPPTYSYSLQGIAADGLPSGTILGATNNAFVASAPTAVSNDSFHELTLGESVTFNTGDKFAIVIEYSSGTVNGSNFASYRAGFPTLTNNYDYGPGYTLSSTGSWSKLSSYLPVVLFGDGTDWYGTPFSGIRTTQSVTSSSNPNEIGLKFVAPSFGALKSYALRGLRIGASLGITTNSQVINLNLYEGGAAGDTTQADTEAIDTDRFVASSSFSPKDLCFVGTAPVIVVGNTYRISITASSASGHSIYGLPLTTANHVIAIGLGSTFHFTTRNGGNWTDNTLVVPLIYGLIVEDLTGSGGGRLVGHSALIG